jgi:hypothetical protein
MKNMIKTAYNMLGDKTPLKTDCGRMCSSACCTGDGGMFLFPGEYDIVKDGKGFRFEKRFLEGYGYVDFMTCLDSCNRAIRPLSCRIFPLVPVFKDDGLFVRLDARGRNICPLTKKSILSLDRDFLNVAKNVFIMLSEDDEISKFLKAVSCMEQKYRQVL